MRTIRVFVALSLSIVVLGGRPAVAEDALTHLPADTAVVVRFTSLDKFASGFKETVSALGPLAAPAAIGIDHGLSEIFAIGADEAAIDRAAPAYVAAFALTGQPEPVVRIVQTDDDAKLRRSVLKSGDENLPAEKVDGGFEKLSKDGRNWYFAKRGEWVLYTPREEVMKSLAAPAKPFAVPSADVIGEGDASIIVNIARLIEVYGDKLDEQRDKLRRQIDSLPKEFLGGDSSAVDPRAMKKTYGDLAELAINAVYDAQWAAGRVNFTAAGVSLAGVVGIKADSATNDLIAANPPTNFETLGLLPAGATAYVAHTSYTSSLLDWTRDWLKLAYGDTETTKKLIAATETLAAAEVTSTATSFSLPSGVDTSLTTVSLTQAKDADKLRAGTTAYEPAANQQDTPLFSQSVEFTADAEKYQDRSVDVLTTHFKFKDVADPGQAIGQKFMEKMFGGSDVQSRLTTVEGMLVQAAGNDPKYLHAALDALQSGDKVLGLDESYAITRDQLAEKANVVGLLNVPRVILDAINMFRTIPPLDMVLAQAPLNLGAQPGTSYAGFSLATQPQGLRLDAYIPVSQPQGVLRIFGR